MRPVAVALRVLVLGLSICAVTACGGQGDVSAPGSRASASATAVRMETKIPPNGPEGSLGALYQKVRADQSYWSTRGIQIINLSINREGHVVIGVDEPERVGDELRAHYADDRLLVTIALHQTPN